MSENIWTLNSDMCRCCHTEGKFKNLAEQCTASGNEKTYADIIKYCFDIDLVPVPGLLCTMTYTICEACILRLRDATQFKNSVVTCEIKFKDFLSRNLITVNDSNINIKTEDETPDSCHDDDYSVEEANDDFDNLEDYACGNEETKMESEETVKIKTKQNQVKIKKQIKSKLTKKMGRPKKMKEEPVVEDSGDKRKDLPPKFRLTDGDYTVDGATFACTRCDKRYEKIFSLRFHVKTKHYKIPRFICPYCKKEFMTPAPLTVHKLEAHDIDDRFKCNACKGTFNTKVQLRKHINNFHMLGERYSCEFCEYESFSFESMYKHKFKHKTSKDHHCKFCRKSFVRKTTLDLHERIHTGDRRKVCSICGQAFVQKASLNYHMTKYHPEVNF